MLYDNIPADSLRNLDKFREKFNFLYMCKSCARSFDSMEPVSACKFCSSEGPEILDMKVRGKLMYRYYCPRCEKNRITESLVEKCASCGSRFIHLYKWGKNSRKELFRMRARELAKKARGRAFALRNGIKSPE